MSRRHGRPTGGHRVGGLTFSDAEVRDIAAAWLTLSVAFAIFFAGGGDRMAATVADAPTEAVRLFVISIVTAGLGMMLHEVAHKVVAVRFGQAAEFRANYQMLAVAVLGALAGFIFAAPGAVHHAGRITDRERGLVALSGPATNVVLGVVFVVPLVLGAVDASGVDSLLWDVGVYGVVVNLFLAGFNMIPFGPLDGRTVLGWSKTVYAVAAVPTIVPAVVVVYLLFL